jgi:hypothetical protein
MCKIFGVKADKMNTVIIIIKIIERNKTSVERYFLEIKEICREFGTKVLGASKDISAPPIFMKSRAAPSSTKPIGPQKYTTIL